MKKYNSKYRVIKECVEYQQASTYLRQLLNKNIDNPETCVGNIISLLQESFEGSKWVHEFSLNDFMLEIAESIEDQYEYENESTEEIIDADEDEEYSNTNGIFYY